MYVLICFCIYLYTYMYLYICLFIQSKICIYVYVYIHIIFIYIYICVQLAVQVNAKTNDPNQGPSPKSCNSHPRPCNYQLPSDAPTLHSKPETSVLKTASTFPCNSSLDMFSVLLRIFNGTAQRGATLEGPGNSSRSAEPPSLLGGSWDLVPTHKQASTSKPNYDWAGLSQASYRD